MKRFIALVGSLAILGACAGTPAAQDSAAGSKLTAAPKPGDAPAGTPVATSGPATAEADQKTTPSNPLKKVFGGGPEYRDVTLPAGTILPVDLETTVGSDISRVEQPVSGRLRRAVTFDGAEVLPAGTTVSGHVTSAQRAGKVKGRASVGLRFTQLDTPGAGSTRISTGTISRLAPATKKKDAVKILAPAAAGAVIGRIAGGKSGAGKGAVIGGGAGAGYVLATRGEDVQIAKGADLAVKLTAPVTIRVRLK
jgi:hypothetical protein